MRFPALPLVPLAPLLACVAPTTVQRKVTPEQIVREEANQREFVVRSNLQQERRLYEVAYSLLRDARSMCPETAPKLGFVATGSDAFAKEWRTAAAAVGIRDTLTVTAVAEESPAGAAGIEPGDRIVALASQPAPTGTGASKTFGERLTRTLAASNGQAQLGYMHDGVRRDVVLVADTLCDYDVGVVQSTDLNAFATGSAVFVTTGMMYMMNDEELATAVAHEIAHNAKKHVQAKTQNATLGAFFGALLDVFAATQGVNTGGEFTSQFGQLGAMTFSQDFEREADYVGMYILAAAGWPLEQAPNLWRRMALASPGSIRFASSHPTTVERYIRLEQAAQEIAEKRQTGVALVPETRDSQRARQAVLARAGGPGPRSTALAPPKQPAAAPPRVTPNPAPTPPALTTPATPPTGPPLRFAGSRADRVYFVVGCSAEKELSEINRVQFPSDLAAKAAGYRASRVPDCGLGDGPAAPADPAVNSTGAFIGSRLDKVFYLRSCTAAQDLADLNRREFADEEEARAAGYQRSKVSGC